MNRLSKYLPRVSRMIEDWPLHPFFWSLFPILSLYASNQSALSSIQIVRALLLSLLLPCLILIVAHIFLPDYRSAAIATSLAILIFFSYGHVYNFVKDWHIGSFNIGRHRYLVPLSFLLLVTVSLRLRGKRIPVTKVTSVLNSVGVLMIGFQLFMLARPTASIGSSDALYHQLPATLAEHSPPDNLPDIYYIILDAYGRNDVFKSVYGFDNSSFLSWLRSEGFYVADKSDANYLHTELSLSSSLNMDYLDTIQKEDGFPRDSFPFDSLIKHSRVRAWLAQEGYSLVAFNSGFRPTDIQDAPEYVDELNSRYSSWSPLLSPRPNSFEQLLIDDSLYLAWRDYQVQHGNPQVYEPTYADHRQQIYGIFSTLGKIGSWKGNHFVFAHVVSPHPPFIFGPEGQARTPPYPFTLADASDFLKFGSREEYERGYVDQVSYIDTRLEEVIPEILAHSDTPPIIIIQGDHGPGACFDQTSIQRSYLPERASILNAYYVPKEMRADLYRSISPVNTFRLMFRDVFGLDINPKPDHVYSRETDTTPLDARIDSAREATPIP